MSFDGRHLHLQKFSFDDRSLIVTGSLMSLMTVDLFVSLIGMGITYFSLTCRDCHSHGETSVYSLRDGPIVTSFSLVSAHSYMK